MESSKVGFRDEIRGYQVLRIVMRLKHFNVETIEVIDLTSLKETEVAGLPLKVVYPSN